MIKKILKMIVSKIYCPIRSRMTIEEARTILNNQSPKPNGTCYTVNEINIKYDLQVIIPVYNSEKYIKACLTSVLQNSKYKVLVTIINDGSTDSTGKILEDMISKIEKEETCVRLINQDNKGYSGARNTALQNIEGRYVMFVDSDDVLPENAIDKMLDVALENEADILQGNWYTFKSERKVVVNTLMSTQEYMSGYPWGKLYKYSVLEHFQFPEGYWFEDTPISFILAAMPLKIVTISDIVYGYRINPQGITATASSSKKSIDSYWVTELCLEEFSKFQLIYDQRAYEYLLKQTLMNAGRVNKQHFKICEAEFVLTSQLILEYFGDKYYTKNKKMRDVEKALKNKRFVQFELLRLNK